MSFFFFLRSSVEVEFFFPLSQNLSTSQKTHALLYLRNRNSVQNVDR